MQGIKKFAKFIILGVLILLIGVFLLIYFLNKPETIEGVDIRLQRLVGSVNLYDENGKDLSLIERMRLNSGNTVKTAKDSLVMMSLDEVKLITLEALSKAKITSSGKKLEIDLEEGNIFFNVTEKLDADATFDISTGNMVCGIRGTSAYGGTDSTGHSFYYSTTGKLYLRAKHPVTGKTVTMELTPGNKAVLFLDDEAEGEDRISFTAVQYKEEDLPPVALNAISKDPELQQLIAEEAGLSIEKINALADATSFAGQSMYGEAAVDLQNQGINDSIPVMGQEAWDMVDTANEAFETSGDSLDLEVAIITGVKDILLEEKESGVEGDDLSMLIKESTSSVCETVKVAKEKGLKDEDLVTLTKAVADTLLASAKKMNGLTAEEVASVFGAITDVYTESITVAANGAEGDPTTAVLGAVSATSEYVTGVVSSEMEIDATGDETVQALIGFVDNEQTAEAQEPLEGQETANGNVVVPAGNGNAGARTLVNNAPAGQQAADATQSTTSSQATTPTASTGTVTDSSTSTSSGSGSDSGTSGGETGGGSESGGESGGDTPPATTYKVTLETDGGTINSGNVTEYTEGQGATLPTDVTKAASAEATYSFAGWYTEASGGNQVTVIGTSATGDKTYYAHWDSTPRSYGINITTDGQGSVSASAGGSTVTSATVGTEITISASPSAEYVFSKWEDTGSVGISDTSSATTTFTMPAKEANVKAVFTAVEYAVSIGTIDHGSLSADKASAAKGTTVTLTATPDSGYELADVVVQGSSGQISVSGSGNSRTFEMPGEAVTATANFSLKDLTITTQYDEQLGGGIEVNDQSYSGVAHMGDTVKATVLVTDSSRYEIDEVVVKDEDGTTVTATEETSGSQKTYTFTMPSKSVTVSATAKKKTYDISFETLQNGSIKAHLAGGTDEIAKAAEGDTVVLDITPASDYKLVEAEVRAGQNPIARADSEATSLEFTMPGEEVTVSATFDAVRYTLTWNAIPENLGGFSAITTGGSDITSQGSAELTKGTTVEVIAYRSNGKLIKFNLVDGDGNSVDAITTSFDIEESNGNYYYLHKASITMPNKNVTLTATEDTENSFNVNFLNAENNPKQAVIEPVNPADYYPVDGTVEFTVEIQGNESGGYNYTVKVVGASGTMLLEEMGSSEHSFTMPPEEVTVTVTTFAEQ